jgi:hypothetical protein
MSPDPLVVSSTPPPEIAIVPSSVTINDPPPPYPSRERRTRRTRRHAHSHNVEMEPDPEGFPEDAAATEAGETAPLLEAMPRVAVRRQRTVSQSTGASVSPSLAQTVVSAFRIELDSDLDYDGEGEERVEEEWGEVEGEESRRGRRAQLVVDGEHMERLGGSRRRRTGYRAKLRRYWHPVMRRAYWAALFHLVVLNFPYALIAAVFLFVFTLVRR